MNKTTDHFKRTIQAYLEQRAAEDKLFAASYSKPNKNIDECVTYLLHWAKSQCDGGNAIGMTGGEVISQAVHYFDEDDIEVGKPLQCQVMVCHDMELTDEEKAEARPPIPSRRTAQVAEPEQADSEKRNPSTTFII